MANNKVQLADGTVLMDVTDTTALASTVKSGDIFYNAAGIRQTGTLIVDETYSIQQNLTNVTSSVDDIKVIAGNCFYTKLTPSEGYNILSVIVTMDGVDITNQAFKPRTGEKVITANGTYDTSEDDFSGYDSVVVNVPNSYNASDEGKVVSNGTLASQTSETVTANDTYDTTLINSLTVNVSGGTIPPLYPLGTSFVSTDWFITCGNGHVRLEARRQITSSQLIGLRWLGVGAAFINSLPTWFSIPSGATVKININNVVNASGLSWNANMRKANATVSLSYGIGDNTHISGESRTFTATTTDNVGAYFLYISATIPNGAVLEFDIAVSVNNVRYF